MKKRNTQILAMRESGATYSAIASQFGICTQNVRNIAKQLQYERELSEKWPMWALLSNRARNILRKEYGDRAFSHPEVIVQSGRRHVSRIRNTGKYTIRELEVALIKIGHITRNQEW